MSLKADFLRYNCRIIDVKACSTHLSYQSLYDNRMTERERERKRTPAISASA
jgi:hypothetical protein